MNGIADECERMAERLALLACEAACDLEKSKLRWASRAMLKVALTLGDKVSYNFKGEV